MPRKSQVKTGEAVLRLGGVHFTFLGSSLNLNPNLNLNPPSCVRRLRLRLEAFQDIGVWLLCSHLPLKFWISVSQIRIQNGRQRDAKFQLQAGSPGQRDFQHSFAAEKETFHPVVGPVAEAQALYIGQLKLRERLQKHDGEFVLWDVGLGGGGNVMAVFDATADLACPLRVVSFDRTTKALRFALEHAAELGYVGPYRTPSEEFLKAGRVVFHNGSQPVCWELQLGDFPTFLRDAPTVPAPHAILFDAFSPAKNPAMWSAPFFGDLHRWLDPGGPAPCRLIRAARCCG